MARWQLTLIAVGAVLIAAAAAVLLDRKLTGRRGTSAATACRARLTTGEVSAFAGWTARQASKVRDPSNGHDLRTLTGVRLWKL